MGLSRLSLAGAVLGAALALAAAVPALAAFQWNLAADYVPFPDQANPNPDSAGRLVWHFFSAPTLAHAPSTYSLMPGFQTTMYLDVPGLNQWYAPGYYDGYWHHYSPHVGLNASGADLTSPVFWAKDTLTLSTGSNSMLNVVGWKSPFTGKVDVNAAWKQLNNGPVNWSVDRGGATLRSGALGSAQPQVAVAMTNVPVTEGEFLFFTLDSAGDFYYDDTGFDLAITTQDDWIPPTSPTNPRGYAYNPLQAGYLRNDLTWTLSTDDTAVAGYIVYRDGAPLASVPQPAPSRTNQTFFVDSAVTEGATYAYAVDAFDAAGNHSAPTAPVTVTTYRSVHTAGVTMSSTSSKALRNETLNIDVKVTDRAGQTVAGVTVEGILRLPNGTSILLPAVVTGSNGIARLTYAASPKLALGTYTFDLRYLVNLPAACYWDKAQDFGYPATWVKKR